MALSVESVVHGKVVSGSDPAPVHDVGMASNPAGSYLDLFWLSFFRMAGTVLDGRHSARVLPSYAGVRQQYPASAARTTARGGFQPEHLVAGTPSARGVG